MQCPSYLQQEMMYNNRRNRSGSGERRAVARRKTIEAAETSRIRDTGAGKETKNGEKEKIHG